MKPIMKLLNDTLFVGVYWTFQQDFARAHAAKSMQKWLTSGSPDLNPLFYETWEKLEKIACKKHYRNLESLKHSLEQVVANFHTETLRKAIERRPEHLRLCIEKEGDHFE